MGLCGWVVWGIGSGGVGAGMGGRSMFAVDGVGG